jgi:hypothetical protein
MSSVKLGGAMKSWVGVNMDADCAKTATLGLDLRQPKTFGSSRQNPTIPPQLRGNRQTSAKIRAIVRRLMTVRDKLART